MAYLVIFLGHRLQWCLLFYMWLIQNYVLLCKVARILLVQAFVVLMENHHLYYGPYLSCYEMYRFLLIRTYRLSQDIAKCLQNYKRIPVLLVLREHLSSYFSVVCEDVLYSGLDKSRENYV